MPKGEVLPENLRCNRTDGRQWRCNRPVLENKKLCEIHHLQGRHRQHREKVPDSLKLERKPNNSLNQEIGAKRKEKKKVKKRKKSNGGDLFDGSLKEIKMKRGDLKLELIRGFLKKQVEKNKEKKIQEIEMQNNDLVKDLANGVMAVTPSQSGEKLSNAGVYNVKIGPNSCSLQQKLFHSKNVEPIHNSAVETLHSLREAMKLRGKTIKCHWCQRSSYHTLIKCTSCHMQFFCEDCIKARCFGKQEVKMACPVCLGTCSCRACSTNKSNDVEEKDYYKDNNNDNTKLLYYLIHVLLPVIEKVNLDQSIELDIESRTKGKTLYELHIPQIKFGHRKLTYCNNCKASIVDFHRSCTRCSYNLCLRCCREFRHGQFSGGIKDDKITYLNGWGDSSSDDELPSKRRYKILRQGSCKKSSATPTVRKSFDVCKDEIIFCPGNSFGGCSKNNLDLRSVFSFDWIKELQVSVEEIIDSYDLPGTPDFGSHYSPCRKTDYRVNRIRLLQETARRNDTSDNFLYYPSVQDLHIEHFQKHWANGHPVILRNLIKSTSKLSWDPFLMFYSFLGQENSNNQNDREAIKSKNCLDWCEVEISNKKTFMGSLDGHPTANVCGETVKLQGWLSSHLFQEHFPAHYAEVLDALPLKEYINPECGILNLALKLPNEMPTADLGPCIYITYGGPEELAQANFLTRLSYDSYDVVNILAHATDVPISTEELSRLRVLLKKHKEQGYRKSKANATGQPLQNQVEVTSMMHGEDVEEVTRKLSLYSEDTEESVSQDVNGEGLNVPDEVFMHSTDSDRGCAQSLIDLNIPIASEQDPEYDSEATVSAAIQESEDYEDESFFQDGIESSSYDDNKSASTSCGAQWDIFRRQDVPKLLEYLRRYSKELTQAYCSPKHVVHPILDQSFFLDAFHIMRLKEEFNIEPWTLKQNIGEAVMIPAGCPYQVRKVKSCVNVALEFISPENAHECMRLAEELRLLPQGHKAKNKIPEVENMTIYAINAAIEEIKQSYTSRFRKV